MATLLENLASELAFPSTSSLINWIIRDWLEQHGLLTPKAPVTLPTGARAEKGEPTWANEAQPVVEKAVEEVSAGG